MNLDTIIDAILKAEGGYVDHSADRGGPTMYGITVAVARANGYQGAMRDLPIGLAREIYRRRYITDPGFDRIGAVNGAIAHELVDTGVNMGPARAAEMLQRCLNVFNAEGSRYADLFVDGRIGPITIAALQSFLRWRGAAGEKVMLTALNCVQGTRYIEIAEGNPSQEAFVYGWLANRVSLPA